MDKQMQWWWDRPLIHPQKNGNIWLVKHYMSRVPLFWGCLIIWIFFSKTSPQKQTPISPSPMAHHCHGFVGAPRNFHQIHRCFFQLLGSKPRFSKAGSLKMGGWAPPPPLCLRGLESDFFLDLGSKIIIRLQVQAVRFAVFFSVVWGKSGRLFCFK